MRRYLIDTTPLAAFLFNRPAAISLMSPWIRNHEATTSILVYGEIVEYLRNRPDYSRRRDQFRVFLRDIYPYFLTYPIMERYADIRRQLRPPHGPGLIGDVDTLIAATALERNLTLVTSDEDFQRVPSLKVTLISRTELRSAR